MSLSCIPHLIGHSILNDYVIALVKRNIDKYHKTASSLPVKEKIEKPIFDYQRILYDALLIPDNYNAMNHTSNTVKHRHLG
jgi:hypothetical protein